MNKTIIILVLLIVPFLGMSQNSATTKDAQQKAVIKTEIAVKKIEPISANPKVQNKTINFKKSNDLISVKAYMRSLQLKRKTTLVS